MVKKTSAKASAFLLVFWLVLCFLFFFFWNQFHPNMEIKFLGGRTGHRQISNVTCLMDKRKLYVGGFICSVHNDKHEFELFPVRIKSV